MFDLGRGRCRARQIGDKRFLRRRPLVGRHDACHAMDRAAADRDDIIERAGKRGLEIALASGQRGETEFRTLRRVDAEWREAVLFQFGLHRGGRRVIGKLQLDRGEAASRRGAEALEQRIFGEQMAEIGGKARHHNVPGVSSLCAKRSADRADETIAAGAFFILPPLPTRSFSRPTLVGRGDRTKCGGRGAGVDEFPATTTKRRVRRPFHHAARGPPPPLSWGRIKQDRSRDAIAPEFCQAITKGRHCEEQSDEAIQHRAPEACFGG